MKVLTMPQRSPEWFAARDRCLVTASDMGPWMFKADATSAKARDKRINDYLANLSAKDEWQQALEDDERKKLEWNIDIKRGNAMEDEAREVYQAITGRTVEQVGLITTNDGLFGASPDGIKLIDPTTGLYGQGLEMKVPRKSTLIGYVRAGGLPDEYRGQCHGSMAIAELDEWEFFAWYPNPAVPYLHVTVHRDSFTDEIERGMREMRRLLEIEEDKIGQIVERQMEGRVV